MQRDHVRTALAKEIGAADVIIVDQQRGSGAGLEEVQEVDLELAAGGLVVPLPFVHDLIHHVGQVAGRLDQAVGKTLQVILVLFFPAPALVVGSRHFPCIVGQFHILTVAVQRSTVGLIEGMPAEIVFRPAVVHRDDNHDVLCIGRLNKRAQAVEIFVVEAVELKLSVFFYPGPQFGRVVTDAFVSFLIRNPHVCPDQHGVDAAPVQSIQISLLIEILPQDHPALRYGVSHGKDCAAAKPDPVSIC